VLAVMGKLKWTSIVSHNTDYFKKLIIDILKTEYDFYYFKILIN
jgi:hypothetical protein